MPASSSCDSETQMLTACMSAQSVLSEVRCCACAMWNDLTPLCPTSSLSSSRLKHQRTNNQATTHQRHSNICLTSPSPSLKMALRAFHGPIIHSLSPTSLEIIPSGAILVSPSGTITHLLRDIDPAAALSSIKSALSSSSQAPPTAEPLTNSTFTDDSDITLHPLPPHSFLIPGLIDTHNHAPQYAQRGLGMGLPLLTWLDTLTFPNEALFSSPSHARNIYSACVTGFLRQGVTTACYYSSLHAGATCILAEICVEKWQRGFVGKCNMTRGSPEWYCETGVESSLRDTEEVVRFIRGLDPKGELVRPILTPRFAISCHGEVLRGLGRMVARSKEGGYGEGGELAVQTHFNEAEEEMRVTRELFPEFGNETDLYESYGLLGEKTVLAHCCYMSEYELGRVKELECGVAHCPAANMTVGGGFMAAPVREFLRRGIKVGLGTDSGGGYSSSMLDAMRLAIVASNAREVMSGGEDKGLSIAEVFYLATLGGAEVCCLEKEIGNFEVGKSFDAIVVGTAGEDQGVMTMVQEGDGLSTVFEKFVMTGDDRNITQVYVRGRLVKG